jgi:hypothetical protein
MVKWDIRHFGEVRIKYGFTEVTEKSGAGNFNDEVKLQFRVWF